MADFILVDAALSPEEWDNIYDSEAAYDGWYVVAFGDFSFRPDIRTGDTGTGSLLHRDVVKYENAPDDLIRAMTRRGITAQRLYI